MGAPDTDKTIDWLRREAHDEPWVLAAILERERLFDAILAAQEAGDYKQEEALRASESHVLNKVSLRKAQLGIEYEQSRPLEDKH